jgi:hypothetical protein
MWWMVRAIDVVGLRLFGMRCVFIGSEQECRSYALCNPLGFHDGVTLAIEEINIEKV